MPMGSAHGIAPDARVRPVRGGAVAPVGEALLGRVLDGAGCPLDGLGTLRTEAVLNEVGDAGYTMRAAKVEPYEE